MQNQCYLNVRSKCILNALRINLKIEDTKTLGLKLFQVGTNLTTVLLVEGKVHKLGLKLRIEKTKVATLKWRQKF